MDGIIGISCNLLEMLNFGPHSPDLQNLQEILEHSQVREPKFYSLQEGVLAGAASEAFLRAGSTPAPISKCEPRSGLTSRVHGEKGSQVHAGFTVFSFSLPDLW